MERPIRVLHVIGGMNRGGIETWLMNVLRHIDRERFQIDFLVHTRQQCAYDEELLAMGCRIIPGGNPRHPLQYALRFRAVLKEYGPYDIVHSHVHYYSGFVLLIAYLSGVRARIAHSHNDTSHELSTSGIFRKWYITWMRTAIHFLASSKLAISYQSASDLYGTNWDQDNRTKVLYYGIDLTRFRQKADRQQIRYGLGIPEEAFVIGHIGRMVPQKNHEFLIQITRCARETIPQLKLLLIGNGPLRGEIECQIRREALEDIVMMAGERQDIPAILRAIDVFLFPSRFEGFGLVLLEAQACGIPCLISDRIPEEVKIIPELVQEKSLSESPGDWAKSALELYRTVQELRIDPLVEIEKKSFDIASSVKRLENLYRSLKLNCVPIRES